jgi:hypothetical protein
MGRSRNVNGVVNAKATLDLIIVDLPEGLPVPTVSSPADVVPPWNHCFESFLEAVFVFAEEYLYDDGGVIVNHPFQVDAKSTILGYSLHEPTPSLLTSEQSIDCKLLTNAIILH